METVLHNSILRSLNLVVKAMHGVLDPTIMESQLHQMLISVHHSVRTVGFVLKEMWQGTVKITVAVTIVYLFTVTAWKSVNLIFYTLQCVKDVKD